MATVNLRMCGEMLPRYEPFKEDLRPGHVEIVEGSAQAERVLGGEGGCWVS